MEEWRTVEEYNDYQISNEGRVKSYKTNTEKIMSHTVNENGYVTIILYKNSKYKHYKIHRLVATAFIPNTENKPYVNHIDGDKNNNFASNLEWCTRSENEIHKHKVLGIKGNMIGKFGKLHPRIKIVNQYNKENGLFIASFYGASEAARVINGHQSNISACCRGIVSSAYGFSWKFNHV
jgi:hypothetical protein